MLGSTALGANACQACAATGSACGSPGRTVVYGARTLRPHSLVRPGAERFGNEDTAAARKAVVETDARSPDPASRGQRGWREAIADGSIRLYGEPSLVRALPDWFGERPSTATSRLERVLAAGS